MTTTREIEVKEFARRIERLCDFFLSRVAERNGSNDVKVIEDLKEDAADIQYNRVQIVATTSIQGLYEYMNAADIIPKEKN